MRGSVIRRGKTWSYVVDVGRDDAGKRRQRWKGGFRTKRDAQRALSELLGKVDEGSWFDASAKTVEEYLDEWLRLVSPRLRPTTAASHSRKRTNQARLARLEGGSSGRPTAATSRSLNRSRSAVLASGA